MKRPIRSGVMMTGHLSGYLVAMSFGSSDHLPLCVLRPAQKKSQTIRKSLGSDPDRRLHPHRPALWFASTRRSPAANKGRKRLLTTRI